MLTQPTDVIELLIKQHRDMEALFDRISDAEPEKRKDLFEKMADDLAIHIKSEEQVFYPEVHTDKIEDDLLESLEEHLSLKRLLSDLLALEPSDKSFEAKFKVLKEQTEHHHKEEEESLFPAVQKTLNQAQRNELGEEVARKQSDLNEGEAPRNLVKSETDSAAPLS